MHFVKLRFGKKPKTHFCRITTETSIHFSRKVRTFRMHDHASRVTLYDTYYNIRFIVRNIIIFRMSRQLHL